MARDMLSISSRNRVPFLADSKRPSWDWAPVKATFFRAEQNTLQKILGNGAAVDTHKGFIAMKPAVMNALGKHLFSRACFSPQISTLVPNFPARSAMVIAVIMATLLPMMWSMI